MNKDEQIGGALEEALDDLRETFIYAAMGKIQTALELFRTPDVEVSVVELPDLYVYEKDNQGTYFLRNTKTRVVSERGSNGGHVEAMCKWLNKVYREGASDAALSASKPGTDPLSKEVRPAVLWFAEEMEAQLRKNDHKGGWSEMDEQHLCHRAGDELVELKDALTKYKPKGPRIAAARDIIEEAADVANFCMMIADNNGDKIGDRKGPTYPRTSAPGTDRDPSKDVVSAGKELLRLKEIKDRASIGRATPDEWKDYHENKDRAWGNLAASLRSSPSVMVPSDEEIANEFFDAKTADVDDKEVVAEYRANVIPNWVALIRYFRSKYLASPKVPTVDLLTNENIDTIAKFVEGPTPNAQRWDAAHSALLVYRNHIRDNKPLPSPTPPTDGK